VVFLVFSLVVTQRSSSSFHENPLKRVFVVRLTSVFRVKTRMHSVRSRQPPLFFFLVQLQLVSFLVCSRVIVHVIDCIHSALVTVHTFVEQYEVLYTTHICTQEFGCRWFSHHPPSACRSCATVVFVGVSQFMFQSCYRFHSDAAIHSDLVVVRFYSLLLVLVRRSVPNWFCH
jgi:hypothetical protein